MIPEASFFKASIKKMLAKPALSVKTLLPRGGEREVFGKIEDI